MNNRLYQLFFFALIFQYVSSAPQENITLKIPQGLINKNISNIGLIHYKENPNFSTALKAKHCPEECDEAWLGDGWCDAACAIPECNHDNGDCEGWCAPDCKTTWLGDSYCDVHCFNSACSYDHGDCKDIFQEGQILFYEADQNDLKDLSYCPISCQRALLGNKVCNDECNFPECNFDDGDCKNLCTATCPRSWLGDGECDYGCNNEKCYFDKGDCNKCKEGCEPGMIANGICDPACDNPDCQYDMGDCYGICWAAEEVDYTTEPFFFSSLSR